MTICEYFTRYGDGGAPGVCRQPATLALMFGGVRPPIRVCRTHAEKIIARFPELGGMERFAAIVDI